MIIDQIAVYHVSMPLVYPWRTAYGEDFSIDSLLVRMTSGSDTAWGESSPLAAPCYSPEFAAGAFTLVRDWLAPRLVGKDVSSGEQLQSELAAFRGNPFAKASLDVAWWVLQSVCAGRPVHHLLGASRSRVPVGADFGVMDSIDDLLTAVGKAVDEGFARVKLKFRPGWDLDMLSAVRSQHPDHAIHIDCNAGYTLEDLDVFKQVDRFHLEMIEQPLGYDDLVDHARLQAAVDTPICLDESINSLERCRQAVELESCRYVNIKPGRVGGLTVARQIHDHCRQSNIPCWVGGMLESATGSRLCAALAMLDNFTYPADIFPSSRFYEADLSAPPLVLQRDELNRPAVSVDNVPGNASVPNPEHLKQWTIRSATIP